MTLLNCSEAAKLPYAPTRQYLHALAKRPSRPDFFVDLGAGEFAVDADHHTFRELLRKRAGKQGSGRKAATRDITKTLADIAAAKNERLRQQIRSLKIGNAKKEQELQRSSEDSIDFDLCDFIFNSYLDHLRGAISPTTQRLQTELENLLSQEMVPGANPRTLAKRISRKIIESEESIIHDAKQATAQDVESWQNPDGRSDI